MATKTKRAPTPPTQTNESPMPGAMPDTRDINFYDADPHLRLLLRMKLSADELARGEPLLRSLGARLGNEIEDLAAEADRATPTLRVRDKRGNPINDVEPSPAYREMERIFYGEYGLAAMSLRAWGQWLVVACLARAQRCADLSGRADRVRAVLPIEHDTRLDAYAQQVRQPGDHRAICCLASLPPTSITC